MQTLKVVSLVFAASVFAAACGDSKSSLNPTAPSAISADPLSAEAGGGNGEHSATAKPAGNGNGGGGNGNGNGGSGNGNGNGNGNQPRTPANTSPAPTAPVPPGRAKVEIEGLISAVGGDSITVNGQVVTVTAQTVIRHGNRRFELSELNEGDRVHVRANRVEAPSAGAGTLVPATLEATEIKLQNPGEDDGEETDPDSLVSVAAFDASASEAGTNVGIFRLTRAGDLTLLTSPLTVTFTLTGTATNGVDYLNVPLTATFAAGAPTVNVTVTPIADGVAEGLETVVLTLTGVAPYSVGSPATATVNLTDTLNPTVSVNASDSLASEAGDPGQFVLTRNGSLTDSLSVTVMFSGSAVNGTDYQMLSTTVTFAAGSATAMVDVQPLADAVVDPSETVILTVLDGASYDLGVDVVATVTITGS